MQVGSRAAAAAVALRAQVMLQLKATRPEQQPREQAHSVASMQHDSDAASKHQHKAAAAKPHAGTRGHGKAAAGKPHARDVAIDLGVPMSRLSVKRSQVPGSPKKANGLGLTHGSAGTAKGASPLGYLVYCKLTQQAVLVVSCSSTGAVQMLSQHPALTLLHAAPKWYTLAVAHLSHDAVLQRSLYRRWMRGLHGVQLVPGMPPWDALQCMGSTDAALPAMARTTHVHSAVQVVEPAAVLEQGGAFLTELPANPLEPAERSSSQPTKADPSLGMGNPSGIVSNDQVGSVQPNPGLAFLAAAKVTARLNALCPALFPLPHALQPQSKAHGTAQVKNAGRAAFDGSGKQGRAVHAGSGHDATAGTDQQQQQQQQSDVMLEEVQGGEEEKARTFTMDMQQAGAEVEAAAPVPPSVEPVAAAASAAAAVHGAQATSLPMAMAPVSVPVPRVLAAALLSVLTATPYTLSQPHARETHALGQADSATQAMTALAVHRNPLTGGTATIHAELAGKASGRDSGKASARPSKRARTDPAGQTHGSLSALRDTRVHVQLAVAAPLDAMLQPGAVQRELMDDKPGLEVMVQVGRH